MVENRIYEIYTVLSKDPKTRVKLFDAKLQKITAGGTAILRADAFDPPISIVATVDQLVSGGNDRYLFRGVPTPDMTLADFKAHHGLDIRGPFKKYKA